MDRGATTKRTWLLLIGAAIAGLLAVWWMSRGNAPANRAATDNNPATDSTPGVEPGGSPSPHRKAGDAKIPTGARGPDAVTETTEPSATTVAPVKVFGRVSGRGNRPVPHVDVIFAGKGAEWTATSNKSGDYALKLAPGSYQVRAVGDRVLGIGLKPLTLGSEPRRYDIHVRQSSVVRGHVRYANGRPAAGAVVVPYLSHSTTVLATRGALGSAEVRDDGSFELYTAPGSLILTASHKAAAGSVRVSGLKPGELRKNVRIVLVPNGYVDGVVHGPKGKVVGAAKVLVSMRVPGTWEYDRVPIPTDAQGRFRYQVIRPGQTIVEATAPGFAQSDPKTFQLDAGQSRTGILLRLHEANRSLSGHVVDTSGNPLAFVEVAQGVMGSKEHYKKTFTDASGSFTISGLGPGPHHLRLRKSGYKQTRQSKLNASKSNIRIVMPPAAGRGPSSR